MPSESQLSVAVGIAVVTCLGWIVSVAVAVVKGKEWLEEIALRVIKSAEGRAAVLGITQEHSERLDEKFEALTRAVDLLGARLEGRMEAMGNKIEGKLERLDADTRNLDRRLYSMEEKAHGK
jgi:hypothetical protein